MTTRSFFRWLDQNGLPLPVTLAIVALCLFAIGGQIGRLRSEASAAAVPTPSLPVVLIATAQPAPIVPTAEPMLEVAAVHYVVAFDQPNGNVMGPIPAPSIEQITARYGDSWLMLEWNGGPAWVRAADLGWNIADLAPERVVVVQQPVYAAPTLAPQVEPNVWPTDLPAPPADDSLPVAGGSGKMPAFDPGPIPSSSGDSFDARWCAAAAAAGKVQCVEQP